MVSNPLPPTKISDARLAECTAESTLFGDDLQEIRTKYNCQKRHSICPCKIASCCPMRYDAAQRSMCKYQSARLSTRRHCVTSQKVIILIVTAVRIPNFINHSGSTIYSYLRLSEKKNTHT